MTLKCHRYSTYANYFMCTRQPCQCIYLIWTQCNQQCHHKPWNTYISHYWHMPLSRCACHIAYVSITEPYKLHITAYVSKTSSQVGYELSSNMYMYYAFGNHIYSLSLMTIYVFLACQTFSFLYLCQTLWKLYSNVYNAHEMLSWKTQIFYICKPYLFFHIYDPLHIPCMAVIFVLANAYAVFTAIHKHFTLGSHGCSFTSMTPYEFLILQIYFFPHLCQYFEFIYTVVYIQNNNAHDVLI